MLLTIPIQNIQSLKTTSVLIFWVYQQLLLFTFCFANVLKYVCVCVCVKINTNIQIILHI